MSKVESINRHPTIQPGKQYMTKVANVVLELCIHKKQRLKHVIPSLIQLVFPTLSKDASFLGITSPFITIAVTKTMEERIKNPPTSNNKPFLFSIHNATFNIPIPYEASTNKTITQRLIPC